jgi:hypothetical protein
MEAIQEHNLGRKQVGRREVEDGSVDVGRARQVPSEEGTAFRNFGKEPLTRHLAVAAT